VYVCSLSYPVCNTHAPYCHLWSYSCQISIKLVFCRQIFEKNTQISNFIKIHPVGAELFHADRRTDGQTEGMTKLSRFSQFCEECLKILRSAHGVNCAFRLCLRLTGFITKMDSLYCAVRSGSINKTAYVPSLRD
jgi:hypothetical protein